jgi:hypothetical protein
LPRTGRWGLAGHAMLCYMKRMPRPAGVLVWTAGAVALHAVVPFELSRLDDRAGRPASRPPAVQGAGLVTVAAGGADGVGAGRPLPGGAARVAAGIWAHAAVPAAARPRVPGAGKDPLRCLDRLRPIRVARVAEMGCKVFDGGTRVTHFRARRVIGCPLPAATSGPYTNTIRAE